MNIFLRIAFNLKAHFSQWIDLKYQPIINEVPTRQPAPLNKIIN
jgi:hypothetical protein